MQRQSLWLVVRGLGLAVLLALFFLRVATPRTYVISGDQVNPAGQAKQGGEAAPRLTEQAIPQGKTQGTRPSGTK
jgi:hypothetical protein